MKKITGVLALCLMSFVALYGSNNAHARSEAAQTPPPRDPFYGQNLTGSYLASQFAQRHHDWHNANKHLEKVLSIVSDDPILLKKAMVLAMGSGNTNEALAFASELNEIEEPNTLNLLFLAVGSFKEQDYEQAATYIKQMPKGGLTTFIGPLMEGWSDAALGKQDTAHLNGNTVHIYHAILIADYMNDPDSIISLLTKVENSGALPLEDKERIADIYGHIGQDKKAISLYRDVLLYSPADPEIIQKIEALENNQSIKLFDQVSSINQGVARAMYDMAEILYTDYADDSSRVFAHLALYLDPDMSDSTLLLASITARNGRMREAINYYRSIKPNDKYFLEARRQAANLLEDSERYEEAITELDDLARNYNDIESLIKIGDIYRRNDEFKKAIVTYNQAAKKLGKDISEDYWYLYYVRGMSYEQAGQWKKAEKDLQAALDMQPDHPYVLNYLGYAWADRGSNLNKSLELIRRASTLRPTDGYITDSLGWVYFKQGNFERAVPHLEKAVELLPYDPIVNDHLGDAYWRVGRKLEARFQWQRARNHSQSEKMDVTLDEKLISGLSQIETLKEARSEYKNDSTNSDHH